MSKLQVGSIVFFNHGKKLELPLSFSNLDDLISKVKQNYISREEAKFLSNLLGTQIEEGSIFNAKFYKKLTEQGFSIIRDMPQIKEGKEENGKRALTAIISDKIKPEDADNLLSYYTLLEQENEIVDFLKQIYVFDVERYYYNGKNENGSLHNEALDIFLNYKTERLSAEEARIIDKYLNFDLQDVLLANTKERALSHKNEGVILISPNGKIYKSTKKKEQHKYEAIEMIENDIGYKVDDKEAEAEKLAKDYGLVVIKLYKTDRNVSAIFCPEEMPEIQVDGIIKCMQEFSRINLKLQEENEPQILTLVEGNRFLKTDFSESANVDAVLKKMLEYERSLKTKGVLGTSMNWIASSVGNFTKVLEKLKRTIPFPSEEPDGR